MLGSVIFLDSHRFRAKASELQRLLQSIPNALSTGGSDSDQQPGVQTSGVERLSMAGTLSWIIRNADGRMSRNSPWTGRWVACPRPVLESDCRRTRYRSRHCRAGVQVAFPETPLPADYRRTHFIELIGACSASRPFPAIKCYWEGL